MTAAPCKHETPATGCPVCAAAGRDARYGRLFGFLPRRQAPPQDRFNQSSAPAKAAPAAPSDCVHFGAPTGAAAACPSCRGAVQLKLFGCAIHGSCTPTKQAPGVACCAGCPQRLPRQVRYDESSLWPGAPGKRFNPSLIAHEGGYLLAYRTGWKGSEIYLGRLDAALKPVGAPWKLRLDHAAAVYGREDPRLFPHDGAVHVAYAGVMGVNSPRHTNVLYARLGDDLRAGRPSFPQIPGRQLWEKNHSYFSHDGGLFAVYSISPHRVMQIDGERAVTRYHLDNPLPWQGGERRGGAPPVRVGGEYWSFFHDRIEKRGLRVYRTGLYAFAARPPFGPLRQISGPILSADERDRPGDQYAAVAFCGGAVREGDNWVLSHGRHDRWLSLDRFSHADLESRLSGPNK